MCIICHCSVPLTRDEFKECFKSNHHGAGFGWHSDGMNHYVKGYMEEEKAWEAYQNVPVPHIAHFRLASAGGVDKNLTHPFTITDDSPISLAYSGSEGILFHNGTITDWKLMLFSLCVNLRHLPDGEMSDTRVMAMAMSQMGSDALAFASASKFAVIDTNGAITRYGEWQENDGNWYTNSGYKTYVAPRGYSSYVSPYSPAYSGTNTYPLALTRGNQVYYQGEWWSRSDYDKKVGVFIPYSERTCENCGLYKGGMKCKKRGKMQNIIKCADWETKKGRGRPKKDGKSDKKEAKAKSSKKKEEDRLAPNGDNPSLTSSCISCKFYEGRNFCGNERLRGPMSNLVPCVHYEREELLAEYDTYRLWGSY